MEKPKPTFNPDRHRPIIIQSVTQPLSKKEISKIEEIARKIVAIEEDAKKQMAPLVMEFREVVGFAHVDIPFDENCECMGFEEPWPDVLSYVNFAKEWRLKWVKEELGIKDEDE